MVGGQRDQELSCGWPLRPAGRVLELGIVKGRPLPGGWSTDLYQEPFPRTVVLDVRWIRVLWKIMSASTGTPQEWAT